MKTRRTTLLFVLLIAAATTATLAGSRLSASRAAATDARHALGVCARQLDELHRWRSGGDAATDSAHPGQPDTSHHQRLLREAAAESGAADKLVSIEPGQPSRLGGDFTQLPLFLRLEGLSMKELTLFLHRLASTDPSSRAASIELTAGGIGTAGVELWHADVTVAYLNHSPEGRP